MDTHQLQNNGIDPDTTFLETPATTTAEFTRQRFDEARRRRDRSAQGSSAFSEDEYHAENERARRVTPGPSRRGSNTLDSHPPRTRRSLGVASSPTTEAVVAAELAARTRREEVRQRRDRSRNARTRDPATTAEEDNEVEEIPRPRVPDDAADALYNLRMKGVLRQFFNHWHTVTIKRVVRVQWLDRLASEYDRKVLLRQAFDTWQEERWFAVVERRAERRYNTILVAKAWSVWVQKTAVIVQRTQEVRQRILMRKYFNAWRMIMIENEEKIRLFQLSNALWRWREQARKKRQMAAVAQRVYEENLVHRAYWSWFFQLCGILGMRRYNKTLREQTFDVWIEKTEKVIQMNRMADAFYRRRTLQLFFNHWSERTLVCLDNTDAALDHADWKLTERTFDNWRRQAKMAPLLNVMVEYVNDRVMGDHVTLWRQRTKQAQSAAGIARRKLLQFGLKSWRLRLRRKCMREQVLERLEISTFKNWVLQTRLRQFKAYKDVNLARGALCHWFNRRHTLKGRLEAVGEEVVVLRNRRLAASVVDLMKQRVELRRQMEGRAQMVYERKVLGQALVRWRLKTDLCRMYEDWVEDAIYYFTVRRALRTWMRAYKNSRKDRLRRAFHMVVRRNKRDLATTVLDIWVTKYDNIREMTGAAEEFNQRHVENVASSQLEVWRRKAREITDMQIKAERFNSIRLIRSHLLMWVNNYRHLQALNEEANILYEAQTIRIAAKYLQKWQDADWNVQLLRMNGSRFEKKRYKSLFRNWKMAAKERVENRKFLENQRGIDDTIDGRFGSDWVQPLPPSQAPPPPLSQDLRQSIFGQSVRGQPPLRQSAFGRSALGRSIGVGGTPAVGNFSVLQTPSWRTAGRSRLFSRTPLQMSRTPAGMPPQTPRGQVMQTPGSPLMRFSRGREGLLSPMDESQHE